MKNIIRVTLGILALAVVLTTGGCVSSEKPNYQGHKGTSPTVYDYYPGKEKK